MDKNVLFFGLLGIGLLYLLLKGTDSVQAQPLRLNAPVQSDNNGVARYRNKEVRNIEWNDEGLPIRITIERNYGIAA